MTDTKPTFTLQEEAKEEDLPSHYVNKEDRVLDPTLIDKNTLERMPNPTGWRLLILPYRGKGKTEGGIYLPHKVQEDSNIATVAGYVLKHIKIKKSFLKNLGVNKAIGLFLLGMRDLDLGLKAGK